MLGIMADRPTPARLAQHSPVSRATRRHSQVIARRPDTLWDHRVGNAVAGDRDGVALGRDDPTIVVEEDDAARDARRGERPGPVDRPEPPVRIDDAKAPVLTGREHTRE